MGVSDEEVLHNVDDAAKKENGAPELPEVLEGEFHGHVSCHDAEGRSNYKSGDGERKAKVQQQHKHGHEHGMGSKQHNQ